MKTENEKEHGHAALDEVSGGNCREQNDHDDEHGQGHEKYFVEIEGVEHLWGSKTITVAEIRTLGNLPLDQPVIEVDPDNNERTLAEDEIVHLKPGHRYGKKVRYKRGLQTRMQQEMDWLRRLYRDAEWHPVGPGGWVKIPAYTFPAPIWNRQIDTICFEVPVGYPGQAPYGFYVTAGLRLQSSGAAPQAYQESVSTLFSGTWGKFSWSHDGTWKPTGDISSGSNLANFVLTFADRLREAS